MKAKNFIYIAIALLAVGCSDSDEKSDQTDLPLLTLNTSINTDSRAAAILGTEFGHEATINVILTGGAAPRTMTYVLKKPTAGAGAWLATSGVSFMLNATEETVYAHYPAELPAGSLLDATNKLLTVGLPATLDFETPETYNADNAFRVSFPDNPDSEVLMAQGEYDYMVGTGSNVVSSAKKTVDITMSHTLAMVAIKATKAPENTNPGVVKSVAFTNTAGGTKPLKNGSFSLADKTFTPSTEISYTRTMDAFAEGTYFALMVYPTDIKDGDVVLNLGVDNANYKIAIPAKVWVSGKIILYNVLLKATAAEILGPVNVIDWPALDPDNDHNFPLE